MAGVGLFAATWVASLERRPADETVDPRPFGRVITAWSARIGWRACAQASQSIKGRANVTARERNDFG